MGTEIDRNRGDLLSAIITQYRISRETEERNHLLDPRRMKRTANFDLLIRSGAEIALIGSEQPLDKCETGGGSSRERRRNIGRTTARNNTEKNPACRIVFSESSESLFSSARNGLNS